MTTIFQCKNGYLLKNPILENLVEKVCLESTNIANTDEKNLSYHEMVEKTKEVIRNTSENNSSIWFIPISSSILYLIFEFGINCIISPSTVTIIC